MADMTNIVDFNNSDGLPPLVIQKLNNNFWNVIHKIIEDEIVIVASVTAPEPRTDETLWYKNDTGELYIWREFDGNWGWDKIDIGYIHVDTVGPYDSGVTYTRKNEFIWIATNPNHGISPPIYFWGDDPRGEYGTGWYPFEFFVEMLVYNYVMYGMTMDQWLSSYEFVEAVKYIHDNPDYEV